MLGRGGGGGGGGGGGDDDDDGNEDGSADDKVLSGTFVHKFSQVSSEMSVLVY